MGDQPVSARRGRAERRPLCRVLAPTVLAALILTVPAAPAAAHAERHPQPPPGLPPEPDRTGEKVAVLRVTAPARAELGATVDVRATLTDRQGNPVEDATIVFLSPVSWGEEISGLAVIGTAATDHDGLASLSVAIRSSGPVSLVARFAGDERFGPARASTGLTVTGSRQLYSSTAGIRVPWLGIWLLATVVAALWVTFLLVARRVLAIARSPAAWQPAPAGAVIAPTAGRFSRRYLLREALPMGMHAYMAAVGGGLVTIIGRSPRTHSNLADGSTALGPYRRTPLSVVGRTVEMEDLPPILDREVSFAREVRPIFLAKAGPHAVLPESSPAPGHVRLDTYEHIMASEELVVPGKPEESELVSVLLDPAMHMPPSGVSLTRDEIQLIVSWVAQGAKDN